MKTFANLEAEQSLLASVLLCHGKGEACDDTFASVRPDELHSPSHQAIYAAMLDVFHQGKPVDFVTVVERLTALGQLEKVGGVSYLLQLGDSLPSAANWRHYKDIVKELSTKRTLARFADYVKKQTADPKLTVDEMLADFANCIDRISLRDVVSNMQHVGTVMVAEFDRMEKAQVGEHEPFGVESGFKCFDECLWGLRPGNLYVIAARPGNCKTNFALNALQHASTTAKKKCAFFSLEMTKEEIARRLMGIAGSVETVDVLTGKALSDSPDMFARWKNNGIFHTSGLYIDDTPAQTAQQILTTCKKLRREHGLDLVVIDYLGKIKPPRPINNPVAEMGERIQAVKNIARTLQVPVLCLAQLNRNIEGKDRDGEALMSDLRGSGEIEQEADVIAFLDLEGDPEQDTRILYMQMLKNRHGRLRNIKFEFLGKFHRLKETAVGVPPSSKPKATQTVMGGG